MVFTQRLQRIDPAKPQDAIKKMANQLMYIQDVLEYKLSNLDSSNIIEIDTDKTVIGDSSGTTSIGSYIHLTGNNGESFTVGKNTSGGFEFSVKGAGGTQVMYLDNEGKGIITQYADLTIDGGEW